MKTTKDNIKRLLLYRQCLNRFKELGFETVFSYSIGNASGVSAVQVRKDFAEFGLKGNRRGGYNIDGLLEKLEELFGTGIKNIIIVGMGNIGKALAQYSQRFFSSNLNIIAGFDIDPSKHKKAYGIPVFSIKKIPETIKFYDVKTAVIAVPAQMSQDICNVLVDEGITGFLNFSPIVLRVPNNVTVNNININIELESLICNTQNKKER